MSDPAATGARVRWGPWAAAALLLLHALLQLHAARRDSLTVDEEAFIVAGVSRWQTGDPRIVPESGEIPMRLAGLVPWLLGARIDASSDAWAGAEHWALGDALFAPREGTVHDGIEPWLLAARLPFIALSVLLAFATWRVARVLFGEPAALTALLLLALQPLVLAHGHLATADVAITLALLLACCAIGAVLRRLSAARVLLSLAATAACFLVKFSAVLLLPIALVLLVARLVDRRPWPRPGGEPIATLAGRLGVLALLVALHAGATIGAIHLAFAGAPAAPEPVVLAAGGWERLELGETTGGGVAVLRSLGLPEAWVYGLAYTTSHAGARPAYALGRWSPDGWWWYFPLALALKVPTAILLLAVLALLGVIARLGAAARGGSGPLRFAPPGPELVALAVVYGGVAVTSSINIGARHLLPLLPPLVLLASSAVVTARRVALVRPRAGRALTALVAALVGAAALEGLLAHPHHVAHFVPLAASDERRWTLLADSNLDWGQDAREVALWLEGEDAPIVIAWFGVSDPRHHGRRASQAIRIDGRAPEQQPLDLPPGTYVVGATELARVYGQAPGRWTAEREAEWRAADRSVRDVVDGRAMPASREEWEGVVTRHRELRLARLCASLRGRPPDAVLGRGGALAWRLDAAALHEALAGPAPLR